jgi:putative hydrolase of the HAD superfamily
MLAEQSSFLRDAAPSERFDDFEGFFEDLYDVMSQPESWRSVVGARGLLLKLRSLQWATAIVSNFDRRLPSLLESLGLADLFDAVVLCSDARAAKPDAAIFHLALERLETPPSRAVMVGDDEDMDLKAARSAGLRAIDVTSLAKLGDLLIELESILDRPDEPRGGSVHGE